MDLQPVALILTGGASRRMGRDKATLAVEGRPMVVRVAQALQEAGCTDIVAVGDPTGGVAALGLSVVADRWPGAGPLGGLVTGSMAAPGRPVVLSACDLPWLDAAAVGAVLAAGDRGNLVIARSDRLEPLCSWWSPPALAVAAASFDAGQRAMLGAIDAARRSGIPIVEVDVEHGALRNVNTADDLLG